MKPLRCEIWREPYTHSRDVYGLNNQEISILDNCVSTVYCLATVMSIVYFVATVLTGFPVFLPLEI